jgi:two-component system LytT family response regulator
LLFLDIQLYNETGFDILNKVNYAGKVIFITAFDEYALRAFEINAIDYLLKPISVERLENAISRLSMDIPEVNNEIKYKYDDRILVTQSSGMRFINICSIIYISSSGDYTKIHTRDRNYLVAKSMNQWEKRLPENYFFRTHRSFIINIEFVEKTEKWVNYSSLVYLKDIEEPLKISRGYMKKFKERFM